MFERSEFTFFKTISKINRIFGSGGAVVIEMLAPLVTTEEYMEDMADEKYEEGIKLGEQRGRKEGIQLGEKIGIQLGEKIGIIKGLFMVNATDDKIIELTKITPEELEKYKKDFDI